MGFLEGFREWRKEREERRIEDMRSQGKCPNCHGTGINYIYAPVEFVYTPQLDCESCSGTGLFSDWALSADRSDLLQ